MISKHISEKEAVKSITALRLGIDNTPDGDSLNNMKVLAEKVFEPLREWVGGPIKINSFYRSTALNEAIGGSHGAGVFHHDHRVVCGHADVRAGRPGDQSRAPRPRRRRGLRTQVAWFGFQRGSSGTDARNSWTGTATLMSNPGDGLILLNSGSIGRR